MSLTHEGGNRKVGNFAGHFLSPADAAITHDEWSVNVNQWLPGSLDGAAG